jgi:UDP-3-O-[3-hydroxymyristoyl] glucosamine N-acyltransferase
MIAAAEAVLEVIQSLWRDPEDERLRALLPVTPERLARFYDNLRGFVATAPRGELRGTIDPAAIVRGEILSMGEDSVIEAGAVIHESCRLILGPRSRIRAGAVLRDEVVVGPDSLIGVHCEVFRSVLIGPRTFLGHFALVADSVIGRDVSVAGNVIFASSMVKKGQTIGFRHGRQRVDTCRSHLGALVGDDVRFGASITLCPGCIVMPGLTLPPQVVLYGTIDSRRRDALMRRFFELWGPDS